MQIKIDLKNKKFIKYYIISFLAVLIFAGSVVIFESKGFGTRKVFIFPSADEGQYVLEYRNLKKDKKQLVNYYIDEILLGSGVERTKKLFAAGTKVQSCFLRGNTLYLDLSADLINAGNDCVNIKDGVDLLEKNVKKNFPKIKNIILFVDGKLAFEN